MAAKIIAASSSFGWKYDVFLSFRGVDTRNNFTGHLYKALDQKGIDTFMDNEKLRAGEEISPTLVTAIQRSRCSIIVLSENFASSKWCLEELVEVLDCNKTKSQKVVPIFYNVDPSHIRNQTGSFGEAMAEHEKNFKIKKEKVQKWREALTQVANLSGFHSLNKSEAQLIEEIIVDVCKDLNCAPSKDTQLLVGVYSCIRELELLLCLESIDVRMVGIWGMGGIGKTTLARVIYERIDHKFEGSCFLADVGDLIRKGEDYLKQQLLSRVLRDKNIDATTTSLKAKLHSKKVLIVIDNVTHRSILKTLAGECNWFGPQSRIIITTRDKQFLTMHGVDAVYEVQKLQDGKDIEVFNYYAFRNDPPSRDVIDLIDHVIAYAQGLPLALEVLGSSLCKKSRDEWMCALNKLKKIPNREIHEALQISFDELDDDEKNIFLDIAFTFVGEDKDVVVEILDSCGFSATSGITTLVDKSLVSIVDGKLHMHDLLKEMGNGIVQQMFPKEPGKRSRLCMQQDVCHVLEKHTGTEDIEIMDLHLSGLEEIRFTYIAFAKMTKLRVLSIHGESSPCEMQCKVHISHDFKLHCDELRLLLWEQYPLKSLPHDFESKNLLWLIIRDGHLTQLWEGNKVFEKLKYIRLYGCKYLRETPDFSRVTNLNMFNCEGCAELYKIHPSLGYLDKLTKLSFEDCINLKHIPGIDHLVSLEILNLSGCSNLEKFPDISQAMPCLLKLYLDGTAITELPSSICYSIQLTLLSLRNCINLEHFPSIHKLVSLEKLILSGCSKLEKFPAILQHMPCLLELYLDGTAITDLPSSIGYATQLVTLILRNCINLEHFPSIDKLVSVETLSLSGCSKLEKFPDILQHMPCLLELYLDGTAITVLPSSIGYATRLVTLSLRNCVNLERFPGINQLISLETLVLSGCSKIDKFPDISQLMLCLSELYLDGTAITELPSSICSAIRLTLLSLESCINLKRFPDIGQIVSIEKLVLSGCSKLEKFPNISQPMPCLSELCLDGTAITELPSSIAFATQLVRLILRKCKNLRSLPSSICKLTRLEILSLSGCSNLGKCEKVNSGNIDALPRTLDQLCSLRRLELQNCRRLSALLVLPSTLELVNATDCLSLEHISPQSILPFGGFIFANCTKLKEYQNTIEHNLMSMATYVDKKRWRSTYNQEIFTQVPFSTVFPATRMPNWFKHRRGGHTIRIKASPNWYSNNFLGFAVSAVMHIGQGSSIYCNLDSHDHNSESGSTRIYSFIDDHMRELDFASGDHQWVAYIPSVFSFDSEKWSRINFTFHADNWFCIVKCCGICPMYIKSSSSDENDNDGNYSSSDSDEGNLGGSFIYDLLQNSMDKSLEEAPSRGSVQEDVKMDTVYWVLISIFGFLFLGHIFLCAPRHLPRIWVSPFGADPLGISRLVGQLLPSPFGMPTLPGIVNIRVGQPSEYWVFSDPTVTYRLGFNSNFLGFAVCVIFVVKDVIHRSPGNIFCELKSDCLHSRKIGYFNNSINWGDEDRFIESDHLWLAYQPRAGLELDDFDWPNKLKSIEASFNIDGIPHQIKICRVHLVYTGDLNDIMPKIIQHSSPHKSSNVLIEEFDTSKPEDRDGNYKNSGECSASGCNNKNSSIFNEVDIEERKPLPMQSNLLISNCWNAMPVFGLILFIFGIGILGCIAMIGHPSLKCE